MAQEQAKSPAGAEAEENGGIDALLETDETDSSKEPRDSVIETDPEEPVQRKPSLAERLRAEQRKAAEAKSEEPRPLELSDPIPSKPISRSRRPAGPAPRRMAATPANDDLPSIGGLIFALQQKPSKAPFLIALLASITWLVIGGLFAYGLIQTQSGGASSVGELLANPSAFTAAVTVLIPLVLFWFLALLVWRAQELRLMASAMSEVAVRLAEPDKLAEQSVASLGQTIRRQVAAMNDAISRAIGRAGELETLVHNEVAALERSYSDNEMRVRGLISELASERDALANNSERVSEALKGVGVQIARELNAASGNIDKRLSERGQKLTELLVARSTEAVEKVEQAQNKVKEYMPALLERLGKEQKRLGQVIEGAAANLTALDNAVGKRTEVLDQTLKDRVKSLETSVGQGALLLENTLKDHTEAFASAVAQGALGLDGVLKERTKLLTTTLGEHTGTLDKSLKERTEQFATAVVHGAAGLDTLMKQRTEVFATAVAQGAAGLDTLMKQRTEVFATAVVQGAAGLDTLMKQRTELFATSIGQGAAGLDSLLQERVKVLAASIGQGAEVLDQTLKQRTDVFAVAVNKGAVELDKMLADRAEAFTNTVIQRSMVVEAAISKQAATIDRTLTERTQSVTSALTDRLRSIDATFTQRTNEIDRVLAEHKRVVEGTLGRQAMQLNEMLAQNSTAIRQTAEQAGAQSTEAVRILTSQTQTLREVSRGMLEQIHNLTQRFENQGQAILTAAKALDSSNTKIDSILENRHLAIVGLLQTVNTKGQELDNMLRSYAGVVEAALTQVEGRVKQIGTALTRDTTGQAQQAIGQIERLREEAQAHTARAVGDLKTGFEAVITQIGRQLEQIRGQFDNTSQGVREAAARTANDLEVLRQEMQHRIESLPKQTAQATAAIRKALAEQIKEVESMAPALSRLTAQGNGTEPPGYRHSPLTRSQPPLTLRSDESYGVAPPPLPPLRARQYDTPQGDLGLVTSNPQTLERRRGPQPPLDYRQPERRRERWPVEGGAHAPSGGGDVLRSPAGQRAPLPAQTGMPASNLRLDEIARAMDHRTAAEVWQRYRAGERGVIGRHIYNLDGQSTFDEISRRYERDRDFRTTVDRYIADFERLLHDAEQNDTEGRVLQNYMTSETGRVYILLAHASGRLR